jgi:GTP-binding protein YchF
MIQLGIVGLPSSGKTTIYNMLTGADLPVGPSGAAMRFEVHTATVDVPDTRLDRLCDLLHPRKKTYTKIVYADVGGFQGEARATELPGQVVNQLEQVDGLLHVVRAFDDPAVPHPAGSIDPERDIATLEMEFLLHDMLMVERRLERLAEERQKGGRDRAVVDREITLFERIAAALEDSTPLREQDIKPEEKEALSGYGLLSVKPVLIVVNQAEGQDVLQIEGHSDRMRVMQLYGKLEMEIAQLAAEEAQEFLAEYGIQESGRKGIVRASFGLLDLLSFFTVNESEARAWTLERGSSVLDAAGAIHSDMARGFIRAEVIAWDALIELGGLAPARTEGKLRLEGKEYIVEDGDVIYIRFNV